MTDEFEKSVPLFFNPQKVSLLIQVNKPFFRPDDLVEFRVFAVDSKTKPYEVKTSKIRILDPENNEVKSWNDLTFKKGLVEANFQLREGDPGVWKILVEADGEVRVPTKINFKDFLQFSLQFASKSFEVLKDKRPIFDLDLSTPSHVSYRDGSIKIRAKVKAVVKSSIIGSSGFTGTLNAVCSDQSGVVKFQKSFRIKDEYSLEIDFKNDLQLTELSTSSFFNLIADYVDDSTNKTFNASTTFDVAMSEYIITITHASQFFKPRIPYSFSLEVTRVDGYPVLNSEAPIEVSVMDDDEFLLVYRNFSLDPRTGAALIQLSGESLTAKTLFIKAKYDRVQYSHEVHKTPYNEKAYLSLNVLTPR